MYKYIILGCVSLGFILGWLFPIEGPYDEGYEELVTSVKKKPSKVAPIKPVKKEILIDLDEDDIPEVYLLVPQLTLGED